MKGKWRDREAVDSKECSKCKVIKPSSEFTRNSQTWNGLSAQCVPCKIERIKEWRKHNKRPLYDGMDPEIAKSRKRRHYHRLKESDPELVRIRNRDNQLWTQYRMTFEQWNIMFDAQGRKCVTCGSQKSRVKGRDWHVDHDHSCCLGDKSCGKCIRGILCNNCNIALGLVRDSTEVLDNMIKYLQKSKGGNVDVHC